MTRATQGGGRFEGSTPSHHSRSISFARIFCRKAGRGRANEEEREWISAMRVARPT
jgi:hypothetical protein